MARPHVQTTPSASASRRFEYELVPLLELPQVDLSVSIKSRLRSRLLDRIVRVVGRSPLTFLGYLIFMLVTIVVFVLPASIGRILAVFGVVLGTPATLTIITMLRYDMVRVLLKTYDIWFFIATSTAAAVVMAMLLNDARSLIFMLSWLSYLVNIFVDANLFGLRSVWVGNIFATICYVACAASITVGLTPVLHRFDVVRVNTHALPAIAIVRDCHLTMVLGIVRNLARRAHHVVAQRTSSSPSLVIPATLFETVNCVSFRCRLQLRPSQIEYRSPTTPTTRVLLATMARPSNETTSTASESVQLKHTPFGMSIDARNTLMRISHTRWLQSSDTQLVQPRVLVWLRRTVKAIAVVGFVATNVSNTAIGLAPLLAGSAASPHFEPIVTVAVVGMASSLVFSAICLACTQRNLLYALITSFDFVFTAGQVTTLHLTLMELCRWTPATTLSLLSSWLWSLWLLYWDALPPVVRHHLGLSHRFAAWIATTLMVMLLANGILIFAVLAPTALRDRVIASIPILGNVVEFRTMSWFFSSSITVVAWSCRLTWRLWDAKEGELVVLDGPVTYERRLRTRHRVHVSPSQPMLAAVVPVPRESNAGRSPTHSR